MTIVNPERPNFLVFCTDQMRADHMGCAGNPVIQTPHLDQLAGNGVHFTRAYVNNPLCMPGRATLFTGLTPRGHRVRTNGVPLDPRIPTMPEALAQAGYATSSCGKIHLSPFNLHRDLAPANPQPADFPECAAFWDQGAITAIPTPYYGLRDVDLTIGHGAFISGDYANWLRDNHPDSWRSLREQKVRDPEDAPEQCATLSIPEDHHHTAYVAERTMERLRGYARSGQPFYQMCSFPDPHHPYHTMEPWASMYDRENIPPPPFREDEFDRLAPFFREVFDKGTVCSGRFAKTDMPMRHRQEIIARTYGMVSLLDKHVGRVMACLEESGLARNTIVVFISDHGDLMGDHRLLNKGPFHFEGLLRVPMIWRMPERFAPSRTTALASLLDFAPTILDLAGVPIPEGLASSEAALQPPAWPGRSLAPILEGRTDKVHDAVIVENDEDYYGLRLRTLITPTHKLTTYTTPDGPASYGELFDLAADPHELENLWDYDAPLRSTLKEQLLHQLIATDMALPRRLSHA